MVQNILKNKVMMCLQLSIPSFSYLSFSIVTSIYPFFFYHLNYQSYLLIINFLLNFKLIFVYI